MDDQTRRRIEEYVGPLAVGLDGVTNFGDIRRVVSCCERIAAGRDGLNRDLLYLLAVFSGQEKWVSRMGHGSRTEIFLSSLGVPHKTVGALLRGVARLGARPGSPEEEIAQDAVRLEAMGAYGIARLLAEGHRERLDILEIAGTIEKAAGSPFWTEAARTLAEPRRRAMLEFATRLREEHGEFERKADS